MTENSSSKTQNPWKTCGSRIVYENPWIRVREDAVICPDGSEGIYGVVEARLATGVIALSPAEEIYLVGQFRYPTNAYSWEIIEGGADHGEDALSAAKRELQEEAGLRAKKWRQLGGEVHLSNCFSAEVGIIFIAEELEETASSPDTTEVLQIKKIPFKESVEMVERGEIQDGLSIIGILRAERLLTVGK